VNETLLSTVDSENFWASQYSRFPPTYWRNNFSLIPAGSPPLLIHFVWVSPETPTWIFKLAVGSALHFHPDARVRIASNTLAEDFFACIGAGDVAVVRYDLKDLVEPFGDDRLRSFVKNETIAKNAGSDLGGEGGSRRSWRYAHESDLVRLLLLAERGGVYLDADVILLRPLPSALTEAPVAMAMSPNANHATLGFEIYSSGNLVSTAVLAANIRFQVTRHALRQMLLALPLRYNGLEWISIGPDLWGDSRFYESTAPSFERTPEEAVALDAAIVAGLNICPNCFVEIFEEKSFYPIVENSAWRVLDNETEGLEAIWPEHLRDLSSALHVSTSNTWRLGEHKRAALEGGTLRGSFIAGLAFAQRVYRECRIPVMG
jgi:hypothetical protein